MLAAALAETWDFGEAVTTIKQAIAIATAGGKAAAVAELTARLKLYQARQPFHQPPVAAMGVREAGAP